METKGGHFTNKSGNGGGELQVMTGEGEDNRGTGRNGLGEVGGARGSFEGKLASSSRQWRDVGTKIPK